MTLATDIASDLSEVFYDTDEFAMSATYTPSGGSAAAVSVIKEEANPAIMDPPPPGDTLIIRAMASEVADPARGDTFVIDSETYYLLENLGGASPGEQRLLLTKSDKRTL